MRVLNIDSVIPSTEEYLRVAILPGQVGMFQSIMGQTPAKSLFRLTTKDNRGTSFLECRTNLTYFDPTAVLFFDGSYTSLS